MFEYKFVESKTERLFSESQHREIIQKYSKEGWRFVASIPIQSNANGVIRIVELVFEKEIKD